MCVCVRACVRVCVCVSLLTVCVLCSLLSSSEKVSWSTGQGISNPQDFINVTTSYGDSTLRVYVLIIIISNSITRTTNIWNTMIVSSNVKKLIHDTAWKSKSITVKYNDCVHHIIM